MNTQYIRPDDGNAVMAAVGNLMPSILVEAIYDGMYKYCRSRDLDPEAYMEYTDCTRSNQLYDRIARSARDLLDALNNSELYYRTTDNKRATDFYLDTRFAFRVKRSKRNRNNQTTNVRTQRQRWIRPSSAMVSIGQLVLPYPSNQIVVSDQERLWLTIAFDLDDAEVAVEKIFIGWELKNRFAWKDRLEAPTEEALVSLPKPVADAIGEKRRGRSA